MKVVERKNVFSPMEVRQLIEGVQSLAQNLIKEGCNPQLAYAKAARHFSKDAHSGQKFKRAAGQFDQHPLHVGNQFPDDPLCAAAGYLHDVIENTNFTIDHLREMGFDERVVHAVDLLTFKKDQLYLDYIMALAHDTIARKVKMADIRHNLQPDRILENKEKNELYTIALAYLESIQDGVLEPGDDIHSFIGTSAFMTKRLTGIEDKSLVYDFTVGVARRHVTLNHRHVRFTSAEPAAPAPTPLSA